MGTEWGASREIICHHPVTRTSPQIPKAPNLDNPSIRELTKNLPRAELFRKHYTNKTLLVKPYFSRYFHELISANNSILQNAHKQAVYRMGTFSWQFLFTLNHSKLIELLNKIIHNSKFIDIKVETLILNECTYTNRWWVEFKIHVYNSRRKTRNITFRTEIGAGYTSVNWPRRLVTANLRTTSSVVSFLLGGGGL